MNLPVIDISRFEDHAQRGEFLTELRHAAHEIGFFYVVGHGVDPRLTETLFTCSRSFFALPAEQKLEVENLNSPQFRGYTRTGTEMTAGASDWREQLDFGPEREAVKLESSDPAWKRLIGPNQWPSHPIELKRTLLTWQAEALRVSLQVLRALAAALGQDEFYFDRWFDDEATLTTKLVHYPPRKANSAGQGVGSHKDYGYLALLQQDDIGGLEVQNETGEWVPAVPIPGSFVFNIGEMLEIATNGYLRATKHRVVSPPPGKDRYSIPFFLAPRLDATVVPIELPRELAADARGVEIEKENPLLACYGDNAVLGWLRSHPLVAQRYWNDVDARTSVV